MGTKRQRGFTLLETLVVVAIVLLIAGMTAPRMLAIMDATKLRTSAQAYAGLLQVARSRAVSDNDIYQVLVDNTLAPPVAYVDLNHNRQVDPGEPGVLLANPIVVTDTDGALPQGFDTTALLNVIPLHDSTSPMVSDGAGGIAPGTAIPGLAFNERGLPCQRQQLPGPPPTIGNCSNNLVGAGLPPTVGYVTYFRYTLRNGALAWAAISITPAGRIKTWSYQGKVGGKDLWR